MNCTVGPAKVRKLGGKNRHHFVHLQNLQNLELDFLPDLWYPVHQKQRKKMAELIVFGVPYGFQTSKCDSETASFLEFFYSTWKPGTEFVVRRRVDNSVHYVFLVHENPNSVFTDAEGRRGAFFGMDLAFKNQYVTDPSKVNKLLQLLYDTYVKGEIIEELPGGSRRHKFKTFVNGGDDFIGNYLVKGLQKLLKNHPELNLDVRPLPPIKNEMQRS